MSLISQLFRKQSFNTNKQNVSRFSREKIVHSSEQLPVIDQEKYQTLYPFLAPIDYKEFTTNSIVIPYLYHSNLEDAKTVVSLAVNHKKQGTSMLNVLNIPEKAVDVLMDTAYKNINELDLKYETQEIFNHKVINVERHLFTSEKILDLNFMKELQSVLGTTSILVSVPRRGHLIVCDAQVNEDIKTKFFNYHYATFIKSEDVFQRVTDDILIYKDGIIDGVICLNQN